MAVRRQPIGLPRKLLFSACALLLLFVGAELLARIAFFQLQGKNALAVVDGFGKLKSLVTKARRDRELADALPFIDLYRAAGAQLRSDEGRDVLAELEECYAQDFRALAADVHATGAKFVVVNFLTWCDPAHGRFVADLAASCNVDHIDLSDALEAVADEHKYLIPADGHLTRYGNQLVAARLAESLNAYAGHTSGMPYTDPTIVLGDYDGTDGELRRQLLHWDPDLAFCLVTNAQGLRMQENLDHAKSRQRVLCLGDSFTFGPHLNNQDTFPAILARRRPDLEIVNAGICGYTITDQRALFAARARHAAADVTILQVCSNDLIELAAFVRNEVGRDGRGTWRPSAAEQRFVDAVRHRLQQQRAESPGIDASPQLRSHR